MGARDSIADLGNWAEVSRRQRLEFLTPPAIITGPGLMSAR